MIEDEELKEDLKAISEKGLVYAENFGKFNKEILGLALLELFFGVEDLLLPALVSTLFGLWTFFNGLFFFKEPYLIIGTILTVIGLLLGKRTWNKVKNFVKENAR